MSAFHCRKNKDLEFFLVSKAMSFEKRKLCRTYIITNIDGYIFGYFSLSLKTITLNNDVSKTLAKKINSGICIGSFTAYLIGQLARNDDCKKEDLSGTEILKYALDKLDKANKIVGGRSVIAECEKHLVKFYEENGFKFLQINPEHHKLVQMIRFL